MKTKIVDAGGHAFLIRPDDPVVYVFDPVAVKWVPVDFLPAVAPQLGGGDDPK